MFTIASEEKYKDGQIIFREGSAGDWLYIILSGSVEIFKTVRGEKFTLDTLGPGEVFGEIAFLGGGKRTATTQALGETTVGLIDRDSIDLEFNRLSSDLRFLIVTESKRFKKMIDRALEFTSRTEPRFKKTISLTYRDRQSFIKAYTDNISKGGLYIKTNNPLKQDEELLLKLQLPGLSEPLKINCAVAWSRKKDGDTDNGHSGMGIKFLEITEKDKQVLRQYIR
jgi:uncharacterized protein (TIGR02266 family)